LKQIIAGMPADASTVTQLVTCDLVEELNGKAILTDKGFRSGLICLLTFSEVSNIDHMSAAGQGKIGPSPPRTGTR
jgi:hypothetical protein